MADPAKRQATYADIEALPPHVVGEIIFGTLVTHPRPSPKHSHAHMALGNLVGQSYQFGSGGPGGWVFLTEPELRLGDAVTVPDLAGWKRERLTPFPETSWIATAPDWICEVLSDSTEKYDRHEKRMIYATAGVKYLWLLDPRAKLLECFVLLAGKWLLQSDFRETETVNAKPFEDLRFSLGLVWPANPMPHPGISE